MAYYAALLSALQSLEEIINRDRYPKFLLDRLQITSVYKKLSHLKALLEDCSPKDEEAANCLERRIRDYAYQVQDILESQDIDEYKVSNLIHSKGKTHRVKTVLPRLLISKLKKATLRQVRDMKKVKEEVDSIVEEVNMMRIKKSHTTQVLKLINQFSTSKQKSTSFGDTMVGFEEQLTTIKDQLCGESSRLEVVPLVGMGGIGKTTLSRSIFDDKLIVDRFDYRAWVTVSQDYCPQNVLLDILGSLNIEPPSGVEEGLLAECLYKHLKGRRYIIIIDDVWETKVWDDMRRALPDDSNGSRIILTTRLSNVAVYAKSSLPFLQIQFLTEDQSWNLLRKKVFVEEDCPVELEHVGRMLAKNCRGLPLAIVVVAGLLSKANKALHEWKEIAENVSSAASKNDVDFSNILSLSYNWLPHHLKPCFLYMGGFPEDHAIPISKLIRLWVAAGFLKGDEFKSSEEIGEEYLEDLVKRNLVMITEKTSNGKFKYCSIHDLLRDLCVERARDEGFLHMMDGNDDYLYTIGARNVIRRLYIHRACSQLKVEEFGSHIDSILLFCSHISIWESFERAFESLREASLQYDKKYKSLILQSVEKYESSPKLHLDFGYDVKELISSLGSSFKLLRVLDGSAVKFSSFPIGVLELSRLRYLALHGFRGFKIPPCISKLQNLQTLIVWSDEKTEISVGKLKMPHLRHLVGSKLQLWWPIPFACVLENLQTLSRVVDFRLTNRAVQMIPNLRKLKVLYNDANNVTWETYCLYNLVQLCELETLDLCFSVPLVLENLSLPKNFSFPQNLKKLSLQGCKFSWKGMTVVGSLSNLQVLKLRDDAFVGDEWESIEGEFTQLKFLLMENLDLKHWRAEETHFPRLEQLEINSCRVLEEIPLEIGYIATLELIEVYSSSESAKYSALQIQEEQKDLGNDVLEVLV